MHSRPRIDVDLVDPFNITEIVDKDNYLKHLSTAKDVCDPNKSYKGVKEEVIPVDFSKLPDARIMKVAPGSHVPKHAHEGPVFRIITQGEAIVNGKHYKENDWMVIPHSFPYEVDAPVGYTALWVCAKC